MNKISVAIASYEMKGRGVFFIDKLITSILKQTYKDVEIVVSDHSINDDIKNFCEKYDNVKYIKNGKNRGYSSANFNNAISNCTGEYIKIFCQDDYFQDDTSLEKTIENIEKSNSKWLISSCYTIYEKTYTYYEPKLVYNLFNNSIGCPSCITIHNSVDVSFDENLIWFTDCEYYYKLHEKYGDPFLLKEPTIIQSLWSGQVSKSINHDIEKRELEYLKNKYRTE